jgi:hypothetical protein
MQEFSFNRDTVIGIRDTFYSAFIHASRFNEKLFDTLSEAYSVYVKTILEGSNIAKDLSDLENVVRSRIRDVFDSRFREEDFVSTLSGTVASYSKLAKLF